MSRLSANPHTSQKYPENRRGTQSHRAYARFSAGEDGSRTAALAGRRAWAKAGRAFAAGKTAVRGRVVNACLRDILCAEFGHADHQLGGR